MENVKVIVNDRQEEVKVFLIEWLCKGIALETERKNND